MKYKEVQEKVGFFADIKINGEKCFTQLLTHVIKLCYKGIHKTDILLIFLSSDITNFLEKQNTLSNNNKDKLAKICRLLHHDKSIVNNLNIFENFLETSNCIFVKLKTVFGSFRLFYLKFETFQNTSKTS